MKEGAVCPPSAAPVLIARVMYYLIGGIITYWGK